MTKNKKQMRRAMMRRMTTFTPKTYFLPPLKVARHSLASFRRASNVDELERERSRRAVLQAWQDKKKRIVCKFRALTVFGLNQLLAQMPIINKNDKANTTATTTGTPPKRHSLHDQMAIASLVGTALVGIGQNFVQTALIKDVGDPMQTSATSNSTILGWTDEGRPIKSKTTIDKLPEKVLLHVFGYLNHSEILQCAYVCKKWKDIAFDSRLWKVLSLRPNYDGLQVTQQDELLRLIKERFAPSLRYFELPTEHVTVPIIQELAKCPKLEYMTLDFSTAAQLHDFTEMQAFPSRLKSLSICLSENIFLEGFLRKIYSYISSVQSLHLIGTYEKIEDEEEEVYETVNLHKLKQHLPNLRVVNLWGVVFISDEHIESLSTNCAQIECLCVNYCQKVTGSSLKVVLSRLKKLKSLLLEQTCLDSKAMIAVEWEKTTLQELNVTATELSQEALASMLTRLAHLRWLSAGYLEGFTDQVMEAWMESGCTSNIVHCDLNTCDGLNEPILTEFINRHGPQLEGLNLAGHHKLTEHFWQHTIPLVPRIKTLMMGIAVDCCAKVQAKIHVDHFMDKIAHHCSGIERLEIRWDEENLRFSDKSAKFVDIIRMRCLKLRSLVLSDGQYYEMVRANFERAERMSVVRTTQMCLTSLVERLYHYKWLLFN